jgi:hypothetical protein
MTLQIERWPAAYPPGSRDNLLMADQLFVLFSIRASSCRWRTAKRCLAPVILTSWSSANATAAKHRVSLAESVVGLEDAREKRQKA